ncbi:hypothetical protein DF185_02275 [Marinifilum breve]|uniref:Uncharacterized protein n=1 Tax=Marinifilum breve TaxID=2184082 RepID=A0A2V4A2R8_9BACT|nr:hypothetical protein [Marinifilum breve]PXY02942.1 hypothetical protein DF185_02275 [Marinifilum breve]
MKYNYFLLILCLACVCCQQKDPNKIIIKPGVGLDDFTFEHSTPDDIFNYKGLFYSVESGQGHIDGYNFYCYYNWTKYIYEELGITFTYSTQCVEDPDTLKKEFVNISLINTPNAYLTNGIKIGKSTYDDVVMEFGKPSPDWFNECFLSYDSPKIDFRFNENGVLYCVKIFREDKK